MRLRAILETIGLSEYSTAYGEVAISAVGGFLGILAIYLGGRWLLGPDAALLIVPSLGASAVLLFAAPKAPFSQPWNVVAGHLLSAVIGVACWRWIPGLAVAASAAVGLAIGAMYLARCIHPPGGATALAAVIGSEQLRELGFGYVLQPILFDVVTILLVAVLFNWLFPWRRYPARPGIEAKPAGTEADRYAPINHEDFVYALSQIDTIVDVSEDDLLKIYRLATRRHQQGIPTAGDG